MPYSAPGSTTSERGKLRAVIFHRAEGWYPLSLPVTDDLSAHAECNPGTLMVTDAASGEILWRPQ